MKITYHIAFLLFAASCTSPDIKTQKMGFDSTPSSEAKKILDSLHSVRVKETIKPPTPQNLTNPIKIISAKIIQEEYSSYKSIRLSWKNISDKKINAVKFSWKGIDAFGDPAEMGSNYIEGIGHGFSDDPLGAHKTTSGTWSIYSGNASKVTHAWAYEVVFADGTKWKE